MTEAEWLAATDPTPLVRFLEGRASDRKLRLFACACCRRVWHLLPDERSRKAVEFAERCDDRTGDDERVAVRGLAYQAAGDLAARYRQMSSDLLDATSPLYREAWMYLRAANAATLTVADDAGEAARVAADRTAVAAGIERSGRVEPEHLEPFRRAEQEQQVGILRDIFGNLRPVAFSPDWCIDTALSLAGTMYENGDFSALPILADALQDAGCDNEEVLNHCRGDGPHFRGCWVVDLVLGKT
jgi:hypothetical protein